MIPLCLECHLESYGEASCQYASKGKKAMFSLLNILLGDSAYRVHGDSEGLSPVQMHRSSHFQGGALECLL